MLQVKLLCSEIREIVAAILTDGESADDTEKWKLINELLNQ